MSPEQVLVGSTSFVSLLVTWHSIEPALILITRECNRHWNTKKNEKNYEHIKPESVEDSIIHSDKVPFTILEMTKGR